MIFDALIEGSAHVQGDVDARPMVLIEAGANLDAPDLDVRPTVQLAVDTLFTAQVEAYLDYVLTPYPAAGVGGLYAAFTLSYNPSVTMEAGAEVPDAWLSQVRPSGHPRGDLEFGEEEILPPSPHYLDPEDPRYEPLPPTPQPEGPHYEDPPVWDIEPIWKFLQGEDTLPNPGDSPGVSPALRYIIEHWRRSVKFGSELRVHFQGDGAHAHGNAIDIAGSDYPVEDARDDRGHRRASRVTSRQHAQMAALSNVARRYPQLFTRWIYSGEGEGPELGRGALNIKDGQIIERFDPEPGSMTAMNLAETTPGVTETHHDKIHVESERDWVEEVLKEERWNAPVDTGDPQDPNEAQGAKRSAKSPTPREELANPPLIPTDIDRGIDSAATLAVTSIPEGFSDGQFVGGLAVLARRRVSTSDNSTRGVVAVHRQVGHASGYTRHWQEVEIGSQGGTFWGLLASQRRGPFVYGLIRGTLPSGIGSTGHLGTYSSAIRFDVGLMAETRFHMNPAQGTHGLPGAFHSGVVTHLFGSGANVAMHVSDHIPPRIWILQGDQVNYVVDDGAPWGYRYRSSYTGDVTYGWQWGQTLQYYPEHADQLPWVLAHPWRSGPYGPPEIWAPVVETTQGGTPTGRLILYRARWGGNYRSDRGPTYYSHQSLRDGDGDLNPAGLAFEHNWRTGSNLVGKVGPFRGITMPSASGSGNLGTHTIQVMRDRRIANRLWLVLTRRNALNVSDGWDAAWFTYSDNDGQTWNRPRQMSPWARGNAREDVDGPASRGAVYAQSSTGDILGPIEHAIDGRSHQSLVSLNYLAKAVSDASREPVVYRRREVPAHSWL